jgi:hypothetical protein
MPQPVRPAPTEFAFPTEYLLFSIASVVLIVLELVQDEAASLTIRPARDDGDNAPYDCRSALQS